MLTVIKSPKTKSGIAADPDSDNLKAAAAYLLEVARSSERRRYRKQPKLDALRQYKEEIITARRQRLVSSFPVIAFPRTTLGNI